MADSTGRRLSPNATAVLVLVVLGAALLLWQRPWQGGSDDAVTAPPVPADAPAILGAQFRELSRAGSLEDFQAAAGQSDRARELAATIWSAREALGADVVDLRYLSGGEVADRADGSTVATVEISWQPGDESALAAGEEPRRSSVQFRMLPEESGGFALQSVRSAGTPLPLWLAGDVSVERGPGAVVVAVDGGDDSLPFLTLAQTAFEAVGRVVPGADSTVTIVSPSTPEQAARLLGSTPDDLAQIAAVTTALDGRSGDVSGTVIVLNPAVFATMDRRAAQVVMTHEATHLMTGAVGAAAEGWVVEGFADFVALRDDTAPLSVSAGQVLRQVEAGDVPQQLPSAGDFDAARHGLGAVYESAWMVFRLLGEERDDKQVVAFYESVRSGASVDDALRDELDLTVDELTAQWRDYLTKSASTVS